MLIWRLVDPESTECYTYAWFMVYKDTEKNTLWTDPTKYGLYLLGITVRVRVGWGHLTQPKRKLPKRGVQLHRDGSHLHLERSHSESVLIHSNLVCCRYSSNPSTPHVKEVIRIFKYLKGTLDQGIIYYMDGGTKSEHGGIRWEGSESQQINKGYLGEIRKSSTFLPSQIWSVPFGYCGKSSNWLRTFHIPTKYLKLWLITTIILFKGSRQRLKISVHLRRNGESSARAWGKSKRFRVVQKRCSTGANPFSGFPKIFGYGRRKGSFVFIYKT